MVWCRLRDDMQLLKKVTTTLGTRLRALLPTCREVTRIQSDALDQSLTTSQRFGLRLHLLICKWCRRYGRQIRFLRQAAHDHPDEMIESVPQKLSDEARERIRQRLQKETR